MLCIFFLTIWSFSISLRREILMVWSTDFSTPRYVNFFKAEQVASLHLDHEIHLLATYKGPYQGYPAELFCKSS